MALPDDMNWFAVHTKRFRETAAAASLVALGFEVFLPMVKVENCEQLAIKRNSKPLFPAYSFAKFSPTTSLDSVESVRGVLYVVKSSGCPVPVEEPVVTELRSRVEADGLIRLQARELKAGDRVSIQHGPFAGMIGRVEAELDDHKRVAILLEALWQARLVFEKRWVELEAA
jgi:transcription antitermination factor NusG